MSSQEIQKALESGKIDDKIKVVLRESLMV
jgi:hypothetical protein